MNLHVLIADLPMQKPSLVFLLYDVASESVTKPSSASEPKAGTLSFISVQHTLYSVLC